MTDPSLEIALHGRVSDVLQRIDEALEKADNGGGRLVTGLELSACGHDLAAAGAAHAAAAAAATMTEHKQEGNAAGRQFIEGEPKALPANAERVVLQVVNGDAPRGPGAAPGRFTLVERIGLAIMTVVMIALSVLIVLSLLSQ